MSIAQWSDLPNELLEIIIDNLHTKTDHTRFRSVCESWRSSALPHQNSVVLPPKVPYLGPPHLRESSLLLTESTVYHLSPPEIGSMASTSNSSLWGWIVKIKESQQLGQQPQPHLINPLSPLRVHPLPDSFPKVLNSLQFRVSEVTKSYALQFSNLNYKVALNPNHDFPSLMTVATGVLWHLKLGQDRWTAIDDTVSQLCYEDVTLYRGKFCAVDEFGRAVVVDSAALKITEIASAIPGGAGDKKNLVDFNGELLLVDRYLTKEHNYMYDINGGRSTSSVKVEEFRLYFLKLDQKKWIEVETLGDQILFLGEDCSYTISAKSFGGCRGNCIIYSDPHFKVYNLDDRRIVPVTQHPEYTNIFNPPKSPPRPRPHGTRRRFFW
ncbi:F-box protein SKIP23-like [Humulus lupulus]|uniref:F-box protein SKIP23-like n=1 Tax=Humulus lupulus TaxID=3486 RepID=UPI002B408691|nr:F-box protein SKIP23-like [Humulus lupulus]